MKAVGGRIQLSATDLSQFLGCQYRTGLDLSAALGRRKAPHRNDSQLDALRQRGLDHETAFVESLRAKGLTVVDLSDIGNDGVAEATRAALSSGPDVIVQAGLRGDRWFGRPDVLRRVDRVSSMRTWSYEVVDTKLTRETKGGTILQLALYSDLLELVQGVKPEGFTVVTTDPAEPLEWYRFDEFAAYYRLIRDRLLSTASIDPDDILSGGYPEPVEACDYW